MTWLQSPYRNVDIDLFCIAYIDPFPYSSEWPRCKAANDALLDRMSYPVCSPSIPGEKRLTEEIVAERVSGSCRDSMILLLRTSDRPALLHFVDSELQDRSLKANLPILDGLGHVEQDNR